MLGAVGYCCVPEMVTTEYCYVQVVGVVKYCGYP